MKKIIVSLIFLISAALLTTEPITFAHFRALFPLEEDINPAADITTDGRYPRFDTLVSISGEISPASKTDKAIIASLGGDFPFQVLFKNRNEIQTAYLTEAQANQLKKINKKGQLFEARLIYIGVLKNKKRLFFLDKITTSNIISDKSSCFADSLLGVKLGSNLVSVFKTLEKQYGKPMDTVQHGMQKGTVFVIDKKTKTAFYIYDGGDEYRDKVYSIQVSTYGESKKELFNGVFFGDTVDQVKEKLNIPFQIHPGGNPEDDIEILHYEQSKCSLETKSGKIYSIFITEE
ncbi:hypothetical protein [Leptospira yasudae]|uniref:Uncharacterized protein n=1 Tax=Leptospira yasudae TaxID=2202201 RepID=A0ABX9M0N4_9LEPT|nr:hypothetical protein [Leptospira yasudae]RHX78829.1 hypothetical protein DLM77_16960 [Leptospira yasudae]